MPTNNKTKTCKQCKNTLDKCAKHGVVHKNGGYPSCPQNKVKPEGVGEWDKLMEDFVFVESRGVRKFVVDKVISLLLQEKAKWKGERATKKKP